MRARIGRRGGLVIVAVAAWLLPVSIPLFNAPSDCDWRIARPGDDDRRAGMNGRWLDDSNPQSTIRNPQSLGCAMGSRALSYDEKLAYADDCDCNVYWWCCGSPSSPSTSTPSCDNPELLALSAERDTLLSEQATLQARLAQISAQIQSDLSVAKPYLDAMCNELQQALDLINQGIAACPNGGNPITLPSFCQLPP